MKAAEEKDTDVCREGKEWWLEWSGRSSFMAYLRRIETPAFVAVVSANCLSPVQSLVATEAIAAESGRESASTSEEILTVFCDEEGWKVSLLSMFCALTDVHVRAQASAAAVNFIKRVTSG